MTTNPVGASPMPMSTLTSTDKSSTAEAENSLGQDAFLKLLVAQLKYQDPLNPADGADFMAQTAQFAMVEKLNEMQKQGEATVTGQQQMQALQMVGKQVAYVDATGMARQGTVESVRLSDQRHGGAARVQHRRSHRRTVVARAVAVDQHRRGYPRCPDVHGIRGHHIGRAEHADPVPQHQWRLRRRCTVIIDRVLETRRSRRGGVRH